MQFEFNEAQRLIRDMAEDFARDHGASESVRAAMETPLGFDVSTWQAICELGLAGLLVPEDLGGQGLGAVEMALVFEALGSHLIPSPLLATGVLATTLLAAVPGEVARALQREITSAPHDMAKRTPNPLQSQRETTPGSHAVTIAEFHDGQAFVLDAHVAECLLAKVENTLLAIRAEQPGVFPGIEIARLTTMDQTRVLSHLSMRPEFDPVPLVIAEGEDVSAAFERALNMGRIAIAAEAVGAARRCLTRTVEYTKERVQFGRKIASFQAVKHQLADVMVSVEAAISAVYYAACAATEMPGELARMAALAKVEASEALTHASGRMIQLHGGIGFTWEHDAHLYFKRARGTATLFGNNASLDEVIAASLGLGDAA